MSVINTNVASLNAQRHLGSTQSLLNTAMERLSSGLRINSARDDAAGLAISDRMTSQIRGLNQAMRNANDGISLAQTAEGALSESTNILQRMRELSIQSANGSNSAADRNALQAEISQLQAELTRIADTTSFGGKNLFDGTFGQTSFQVGSEANQTISFSLKKMDAASIGVQRVELDSATANTGTGRATAAANATAGVNNIAGGVVTVSGTSSADVTIGAAASAREMAALINAEAGNTSVSADARTVARLSTLSDAGNVTFTLTADTGSATNSAQISATVSSVTDLTSLADAINAEAGTTGIQAAVNGTGDTIDLINENGDDIVIEGFAVGDPTAGASTIALDVRDFGNAASNETVTLTENTTDSTRVMGELRLSSAKAFSVTSADATVNPLTPEASALAQISSLDISTIAGSQNAVDVIDGALDQINGIRADLGAVQNRLDHTISNLGNVKENVEASRSRIMDADFAAETARLTKAQVLQQAGTAMLAQANAAPQGVLALLR